MGLFPLKTQILSSPNSSSPLSLNILSKSNFTAVITWEVNQEIAQARENHLTKMFREAHHFDP